MFQFRRFPSYAYFVQRRMTGYCPAGLPHSEIPGSMDICSSPRLFAACHVLLRLLMPRHSPCALSSLTIVEETRSIPFPPLGENFISAPSFSSFRRKLVFGEGDGSCGFEPFDLSENSWFSLRIMQAYKDRNCMSPCILSDAVPQSICFVVCLHTTPLCCLTCFVTLFSFQGAGFQPLLQSDLKIRPFTVRSSNPKANRLVGPSGLEPPTLRLSVVRSSQLSYGPSYLYEGSLFWWR